MKYADGLSFWQMVFPPAGLRVRAHDPPLLRRPDPSAEPGAMQARVADGF